MNVARAYKRNEDQDRGGRKNCVVYWIIKAQAVGLFKESDTVLFLNLHCNNGFRVLILCIIIYNKYIESASGAVVSEIHLHQGKPNVYTGPPLFMTSSYKN